MQIMDVSHQKERFHKDSEEITEDDLTIVQLKKMNEYDTISH